MALKRACWAKNGLYTHGYNFYYFIILHRSKILFLDIFGGPIFYNGTVGLKIFTLVASPPEDCPSYPDYVKNMCQPCDITFREAKMSHLDLCDFSSPFVSPPTLHLLYSFRYKVHGETETIIVLYTYL